jgi:hypothetical protein
MSCYIDQMETRELVPDDVWAQLRPADARLTKLSSARLRLLLGAAGVLVATVAALTAVSGLLMPQLNETGSGGSAELTSRTVTQSVDLRNDGWLTEHIDRIDTSGPGLRVTGHNGGLAIGPGERATLEVTYQITDCSVIRSDQPTPVVLRLHRPWGHRTTTLAASTTSPGLAWRVCHAPN